MLLWKNIDETRVSDFLKDKELFQIKELAYKKTMGNFNQYFIKFFIEDFNNFIELIIFEKNDDVVLDMEDNKKLISFSSIYNSSDLNFFSYMNEKYAIIQSHKGYTSQIIEAISMSLPNLSYLSEKIEEHYKNYTIDSLYVKEIEYKVNKLYESIDKTTLLNKQTILNKLLALEKEYLLEINKANFTEEERYNIFLRLYNKSEIKYTIHSSRNNIEAIYFDDNTISLMKTEDFITPGFLITYDNNNLCVEKYLYIEDSLPLIDNELASFLNEYDYTFYNIFFILLQNKKKEILKINNNEVSIINDISHLNYLLNNILKNYNFVNELDSFYEYINNYILVKNNGYCNIAYTIIEAINLVKFNENDNIIESKNNTYNQLIHLPEIYKKNIYLLDTYMGKPINCEINTDLIIPDKYKKEITSILSKIKPFIEEESFNKINEKISYKKNIKIKM